MDVNNAANALGFGWLFAYSVMSGSPVAAITLTLLDVGTLNATQAFAMISGSRLGASFIVLFIGFMYTLRGRERKASMSSGLLSLVVTQTVYIPVLFLGTWLLNRGWMDQVQLAQGAELSSFFDLIFDPIMTLILAWLPRWAVFALGFGVLMGSFALLDRALPEMHLEEGAFQGMPRILYRPIVTFLLGALVTTVTMSVSLSLSILVPLSVRGYIRRENIIPYIMGANITTFVDTLMAAVLLGNPNAFTVVLVNMMSVAVVSMIIIGLIYLPYERGILRFVNYLLNHNLALALYMFGIVGIPILLMLF
ncbi:MAG: hypothetical protein HUU38_06575 [Anaerolineales bacterium]|nr:hypothetical protein [Anaerolineales bacterium]